MITSLYSSRDVSCAAPSTRREGAGPASRAASAPRAGGSGSAWRRSSIVWVEKQTENALLVSWSDPTHCRYDEQRWIAAKSRISGRCALTGQAIEIGDPVYKPQWRGGCRPANSGEMILANQLDRPAGRARAR